MRTLILSDLHLGNGGPYDVFAGERELPALLGRFESAPVRVLVNGDGFDFLMNDDPLELSELRSERQAKELAAHATTRATLESFGRILAAGGEVIVRLGNHDVELAYPKVQDILRSATGQPAETAARLKFELGSRPGFVEVGGATILVTHGEHNDAWNQVDYEHLTRKQDEFAYAPGSRLVKRFLNPLTKRHGMRFVSMLKPDFQGGALCAFAVSPSITKLVFQDASANIAWQLLKKTSTASTFVGEGDEEDDLGLAARVDEAELSDEEKAAVESILGDDAQTFSDDEDGGLFGARAKLARAGLKLYASIQKKAAGKKVDEYFELEPSDPEWREAKRLAKKYDVGAIVMGHTHAARWRSAEGLVFANSGTWSWLMQMPPAEAAHDVWAEYMLELAKNPGLKPHAQRSAKMIGRFNAVLAEPHANGGAELKLLLLDGDRLETLGVERVPARGAAK